MTMHFKIKYQEGGAHVHFRMFAGTNLDALGGCTPSNVTMRSEEFLAFMDTMVAGENALMNSSSEFVERDVKVIFETNDNIVPTHTPSWQTDH